ncbi:MAG: DNA-directed DNA polymerase II small subunit [Candidatus Thermoplasmatota archaeon]|nr:DNA-directed DNA polymerase II small subunit [Candidatus Thermoplasmatota archaeon]
MKNRVLGALTEKGILVEPDALNALVQAPDAMRCVQLISDDHENRPLILTRTDVESYLECLSTERPPKAGKKTVERPVTRSPEKAAGQPSPASGMRILKDITGDSTCVGNVIDFAKLFNDRFVTLKKMLAKRRELSGLVSIARAKRVQRDVRFVGMVNDVRSTKQGHTMLELEDEEDKVQVLVMKTAPRVLLGSFIKDEVVGVIGSFSKDGEIVLAKDFVRPDVPLNSGMVQNGADSIVAFVSDIHVGSTEFMEDAWERFMAWLAKDPVAKEIRYIVMPGDLVDGIGIYPGQEDELAIEDVYDQYNELARLAAKIPERIKIVMMPGNHDAVRLAEPQPALPKEVTSMFDSRVTFVGNPCYMDIEGRIILAYHGRSMDDFVANVRSLSYREPEKIMADMLRRRHMAPIYGEKTAIAPEQKDYLVIDRVPEIFVTGHIHACKVDEYRGIKLINASAWQSQTAFQRMHNQIPDPAKVPMVDLGSGESWVEDFSS